MRVLHYKLSSRGSVKINWTYRGGVCQDAEPTRKWLKGGGNLSSAWDRRADLIVRK